ncbi:MAG: GGDEF domain-containing protein [Lachnospiraceae bacterium]|nr:GGDEF domain-containing protein [Lachnospiraceae bacterium]
MNRFFTRFKALILKDVSNENETKDLAVLLRVLCIVFTAFNLCSSVALACINYFTLAIAALLCAGLYIGLFICTYDNKTKSALTGFQVVTTFNAILLTLGTGWKMNFQWEILVLILIIFYTLEKEIKTKLKNAGIYLTILVALGILAHLAPLGKDVSPLFSFIFQTLTSCFYGVTICCIAFCYSTKFNQAEAKLRKSNSKLMEMASLDALTQLPNRRNMTEHLTMLVYQYNRTGKPFCIAIADVDFFKRINDNYGHDAGDYILTSLADIFRTTMRGRGMVARWGGEEFLFCFEGMNGSQAYSMLEVLRNQIEKKRFTYKEQNLNVTVTFGLEEFSQIIGVEATISKADAKLYEGKSTGRNKTVF